MTPAKEKEHEPTYVHREMTEKITEGGKEVPNPSGSMKALSVTRSFRINESAFLAFEEEAKKRNISLNTLVNQLFMSYANFDRDF